MAQGKSPVLTDTQKAKKKKGLCITPFCMKKIRRAKGKPNGNICSSCHIKLWQVKYPLMYTYGVKRRNARRKKKYFNLTFEEFKEFAEKNDYMKKKGTSAKSMHIDRIEDCVPGCPDFCEKHGYIKDNIQGITLCENVHKYQKHKRDYSNVPF